MHNQREVDVPSSELDPSVQLSRRRDTPVDALSDNEPLIRPNNGRQVVPRMEPVQPSPGDLSATVPASSGVLRAAGAMGGAMQSVIGGRANLPSAEVPPSQARGPSRNRFAALSQDAEGILAPSRPEEFAMTEGSDTESCELVVRPSRRLTVRWNPSVPDDAAPMILQERRQRQVLDAEAFFTRVCERVGPLHRMEDGIPRSIRRQQWSALNVPLMWSAAEGNRGCAVLEWLIAKAQQTPSLHVAGEEVPGRQAALMGWEALQGDHIQGRSLGFPRPHWGAHFSGRAQERILNFTVSQDARGSAIEALYVHIVLHKCCSVHHVPINPAFSAHSDRRPIGRFWTGTTCMRFSK